MNTINVAGAQPEENKDWRFELKQYLSNSSSKTKYKLKQKALKHVLVSDELLKRSQEWLLLKCVAGGEAKKIMHEGIYGAHKSGPKMRWLIHRYGYY